MPTLSLAWLVLATFVAVSWYFTCEICRSSHSALIRAASPVLELAVPVLVFGGLFHLGLSARHLDRNAAPPDAPMAAAQVPASPPPADVAR